ncbi:hypothetical protein V2J09_010529 [Rumex salicifolius]
MDDSSNPLIEGELEAADIDGFSLIDGSELDDLFVSMSEPSLGDIKVNMVDGGANMLERSETERPRKNEKYNLRKSLAWDSAFFTNAGVLDAEELSSIMEGGNGGKHQLQHLPGIQEDVSKSTDSLSTFESDNLTLESLEADLFSDIRASIQRSGESSKSRKSNLNDRLEETSQLGKKTSETKHGNMVKTKSTPKKLITNLQGNGKLVKLGPSREQVRKSVGCRKEPISSLPKPAAASAKGSTIVMAPAKVPTKRMSISAGRIKSDSSNLGNETGRVTTVSKGDRPSGPRSIIPKGASHAKPSSVSSTIPKGASHAKPSSFSSTNTRTVISSTRSSYDSTSSSSHSSRILPLNAMQGKAIKPASVFPPGVKSRIPSRVPVKSKNPPGNSRISVKLSASTLSSSVSPTSSISEWSSCSSTFTANQEHSASTENSSLHRTFSLDSNASQDLQIHPNQLGCCGDEEVASASDVSVSNPISAKPSGLRMPSPKIGFFDGVKSGVRTQNTVGSTQSRSRLSSSRLPKSTPGNSSPGGVPNRGRTGHITVKPTALAGQNTNSDNGRSNSRITGGGHMEGIFKAEESNVTSREHFTEKTLLKTNEENNSRVAKLPVGEKQHLTARKKSGLVCSSKNATPQGKSHSLTNQVSCAVEADRHINEINETIEPNALLLDELINGEIVNTDLHSIMSEEVGYATTEKNVPGCTMINMSEEADNAIKADENGYKGVEGGECEANNEKNDPLCGEINTSEEVDNANNRGEFADTVVLSQVPGGCEATNEKNDPICVVINNSEEVCNDENTEMIRSGGCEATNKKNDPLYAEINISEEVGNAIIIDDNADTMVLSGGCEAANKKNDPICFGINMFEEVCNNENADTGVQSGGYEATKEKNDPLCTEIYMSEVGNAININDNADTFELGRGCEATNEKNGPNCAVITDQQNAFAEQQNVEAMSSKMELCVAMDGYFEPQGDASSVEDSHSPALSSTVELSGLNEEGDAANLHKQTGICLSSKILESKTCPRTPFADKNSSPGAFSIEVLMKRFTSLSLDNIQAKDV